MSKILGATPMSLGHAYLFLHNVKCFLLLRTMAYAPLRYDL
jgi:hypothetical protein